MPGSVEQVSAGVIEAIEISDQGKASLAIAHDRMVPMFAESVAGRIGGLRAALSELAVGSLVETAKSAAELIVEGGLKVGDAAARYRGILNPDGKGDIQNSHAQDALTHGEAAIHTFYGPGGVLEGSRFLVTGLQELAGHIAAAQRLLDELESTTTAVENGVVAGANHAGEAAQAALRYVDEIAAT